MTRSSAPVRRALPLYARMLRLRHLAPSGLLCFVFLEGAVVLGVLLALAELVSWWGVVVLPVTVALMVKFNDLVAGAIVPRPVAGEGTSPSRSSVLRPAAMAAPVEDSPGERTAVLRAPERGNGFGPAFSRPPGGGSRSRSGEQGVYVSGSGFDGARAAGSGSASAERSYRSDSDGYESGDGFTPAAAPVTGGFRPAGMPLTGGYAPIVSTDPADLGYEPGTSLDGMSGVPAVGYPGSYSRGLSVSSGRSGDEGQQHQVRSAVEPAEESRGNNAPVRRAWADELDVRQQMARRAASRRYE